MSETSTRITITASNVGRILENSAPNWIGSYVGDSGNHKEAIG